MPLLTFITNLGMGGSPVTIQTKVFRAVKQDFANAGAEQRDFSTAGAEKQDHATAGAEAMQISPRGV